MTPEQLRLFDAVRVTVMAADRLRDSLRSEGAELRSAISLTPQGEPGALREVDAFVQRYQQMVEHMTRRLFGAIYRAEELGDRPPPLMRLLTYLEGIAALRDADAWKVHVELRNRLVHEYPVDAEDRLRALKDAADASQAILADLDAALAYITERRLLELSDDQ